MKDGAPKEARASAFKEINTALTKCGGDVSQAAFLLGVGRVTLHRWISNHERLQAFLDMARRRGRT